MAFFNPLETEQRVLIQLVDRSDAVEASIAPVVDTLTPDVSEGEDYRFQGEVSRIPIEDGSMVSDHITIAPFDIELDLRFSDVSFSKFNPLEALNSVSGRGREKALKLISWFRAKNQYILTTSFASFDNVAISQIDVPRSSADGRSVLCRVTFAEIPLVARSGLEVQGLIRSVISAVEHTAFGLVVLGDLS